jgi:hypothetical protein
MNEAKSGNARPLPSTAAPSATSAKKREPLPRPRATATVDMKSKADSSRMNSSYPLSVYRKLSGPTVQPGAPSDATSSTVQPSKAPSLPVRSDTQSGNAAPSVMLSEESLKFAFPTTQDKHTFKAAASSTVQPSTPSKDNLPAAQSTPTAKDVLNVSAASHLDFELIEDDSNVPTINTEPQKRMAPIKRAAPIWLAQVAAAEHEDFDTTPVEYNLPQEVTATNTKKRKPRRPLDDPLRSSKASKVTMDSPASVAKDNSALSAPTRVLAATKKGPRIVKETPVSKEPSSKRDATPVKKKTVPAKTTTTPAQYVGLDNHGKAIGSEQETSLERMKTDAVATIKKHISAIDDARNEIFSVYRADKSHLKRAKSDIQEALKVGLNALTSYRDAAEADLRKLKMMWLRLVRRRQLVRQKSRSRNRRAMVASSALINVEV